MQRLCNKTFGNEPADLDVIDGVTRMHNPGLVVASLAVAGLLLGACGGAPGAPVPAGSSAPADPLTGPASGAPTATPTAPTTPPPGTEVNPGEPPPRPDNKAPGSGKPAAPMTLTGVVTSGVEPGCILLNGFLLIGGPRETLRAGAKVTVTGRIQVGLLSTCQQGTPFVVEAAMREE